jgi:hypothetical protein
MKPDVPTLMAMILPTLGHGDGHARTLPTMPTGRRRP